MSDSYSARVTRLSGRPLQLDIFPPKTRSLGACVILLHGGGWMFGNRSDTFDYARELAATGFTAIAAEYRLIGEAAWPAQLQDVKDVVVWTRREAAALGIAADKIALQGFSAGGHLALLAAATAHETPCGETTAGEPVAAVVALFAPSQLLLPPVEAGPHPVRALLGAAASDATAAAASPLTYVSGFPPTCLIHGTADPLIPHHAALGLFGALEAAQRPVELHLYHGCGHEFAALPSMLAPVQATIALFLKRTVVDPGFYEHEHRTLNPFAGGIPAIPPVPATA
jgi:acetyl esterase/lipase